MTPVRFGIKGASSCKLVGESVCKVVDVSGRVSGVVVVVAVVVAVSVVKEGGAVVTSVA